MLFESFCQKTKYKKTKKNNGEGGGQWQWPLALSQWHFCLSFEKFMAMASKI